MQIDEYVEDQLNKIGESIRRMSVRVAKVDVHAFRVSFKKIRSIARTYGNAGAVDGLRGLNRVCGAVREAEIRIDLLQGEEIRQLVSVEPLVKLLLVERHKARCVVKLLSVSDTNGVVDAREQLVVSRTAISDMELNTRISGRILKLQRLTCKKRTEIGHVETLHDVRKALKDLMYLLPFRPDVNVAEMRKRRVMVNEAESQLGAVNDLADLQRWVASMQPDGVDRVETQPVRKHLLRRIQAETRYAKKVLKLICSNW